MNARYAYFMMDRWSDRLILALATPHSLEFYAAIYALAWGLSTMLWPDFLIYPATFWLFEAFGAHGWTVGLVPFLAGVVGMYGLTAGRRKLRAYSAIAAATFWWMATGVFFLAEPPLTAAVVTYGAAALGEAWVYVRVTQPWHTQVRKELDGAARHDRFAPRGA
jgi:hypothetical protein